MQPTLYSLALFILLSGCQAEKPPKKAVFIILDGIPADVLERVDTPTLDAIAAEGGYTRAYVGGDKGTYNETPTISAPGYMDLITGAWAHKHNVWDNAPDSTNYNFWNLFHIAENADTALHTAIFSTWLDNRTVLIGEGKPGAGDFRLNYAFDGFELDTLRFPHDEDSGYILQIDEMVAAEAGNYIAANGPDLSWVYLQFTDDMGHHHGDSEPFYDAVRKADNQVKRIWEAVQKRQALGEDWLIVITTDHGRDPETGKNHGGQSDRERTTWIVTNAKDLNSRFTNYDPAVVDIAPSILRHMGIQPPEAIAAEMDGVPFTGDLSVHNLQATLNGNTLHATWDAAREDGEVQALIALTNHFDLGGRDTYEMLGSFPVKQRFLNVELTPEQLLKLEQNGFGKLVLKAPNNLASRWVVASN